MQKDETTLLKSSLKKERSSSKRAAIKSALDKIVNIHSFQDLCSFLSHSSVDFDEEDEYDEGGKTSSY